MNIVLEDATDDTPGASNSDIGFVVSTPYYTSYSR